MSVGDGDGPRQGPGVGARGPVALGEPVDESQRDVVLGEAGAQGLEERDAVAREQLLDDHHAAGASGSGRRALRLRHPRYRPDRRTLRTADGIAASPRLSRLRRAAQTAAEPSGIAGSWSRSSFSERTAAYQR